MSGLFSVNGTSFLVLHQWLNCSSQNSTYKLSAYHSKDCTSRLMTRQSFILHQRTIIYQRVIIQQRFVIVQLPEMHQWMAFYWIHCKSNYHQSGVWPKESRITVRRKLWKEKSARFEKIKRKYLKKEKEKKVEIEKMVIGRFYILRIVSFQPWTEIKYTARRIYILHIVS